ncbi:MAG: HNH endonuclease signature motif containing protein [candidate division WOR-3 bacterium]
MKENPFCVICMKEGIIRAAEIADHIIQIRVGGAKWDKNNLQALCKKCHAKKSGKEAHYGKNNRNRPSF